MKEISESVLWETFKKRDKKAFHEIYQQYCPQLLNYGLKITQDIALVEDSIQDLFVELWKSGDSLSPTTSIKFYLFKALRWKIGRNRNKGHLDDMLPMEGFMTLLKDIPYEDVLVNEENSEQQLQQLRDNLEKLPKRQREAINLRYYHNFNNEDVANIMGINYNTACKFIYAGLKNLKQYLKVAVVFLGGILATFINF